jgi:hypothetical protein
MCGIALRCCRPRDGCVYPFCMRILRIVTSLTLDLRGLPLKWRKSTTIKGGGIETSSQIKFYRSREFYKKLLS